MTDKRTQFPGFSGNSSVKMQACPSCHCEGWIMDDGSWLRNAKQRSYDFQYKNTYGIRLLQSSPQSERMQIFPAWPEKWKQNLRRQKIGINRKVLAELLCGEHNDLKIGSLKGALPRKNNQISRDMDEFLGRTMMDGRKWQEKTIDIQDNRPSDPFTFLKLFFCPCVNREESWLDTQNKRRGGGNWHFMWAKSVTR